MGQPQSEVHSQELEKMGESRPSKAFSTSRVCRDYLSGVLWRKSIRREGESVRKKEKKTWVGHLTEESETGTQWE